MERVGRHDAAIKLLPALATEPELLERGCTVLQQAISACIEKVGPIRR